METKKRMTALGNEEIGMAEADAAEAGVDEDFMRVMSYMTDHGHIFPSWEDICLLTGGIGDPRGRRHKSQVRAASASGH